MKKTKTKTIKLTIPQYKFLLRCLDDIIVAEAEASCTNESKMNRAERLIKVLEDN